MNNLILKKGDQAIFTIEGTTSGGLRGRENPPSEYVTATMGNDGVVDIFRFKKDGSFRKIETVDNGYTYLQAISERRNEHNLIINEKPEDILTNEQLSKRLVDSIDDFKKRELDFEKEAFEYSKKSVVQQLFIEPIDEYNPEARRADPMLFTITPTGDPQNPTFETKLQVIKPDGRVIDMSDSPVSHQSKVNVLRGRYSLGYDGKEIINFKGVDNFISPADALKISNGDLKPPNQEPELRKTEQIIFDKSKISDVAVVEKNDGKSTATLYKNDGEVKELNPKESSQLIKSLSDAGEKPLLIISDAKKFISSLSIKEMVSSVGGFAKNLFNSTKETLGNAYDTVDNALDVGGAYLDNAFDKISNKISGSDKPSPQMKSDIDYGVVAKDKPDFKGGSGIDYESIIAEKPEAKSSLSQSIPGIDDPAIDYKSVSIPEGKPKPDGIPQAKVESKQNRLNKI